METLLTTKTQVDEHRQQHLAPEVLLRKIVPGLRYLLNLPPALGKTTALVNLINHPDFFSCFDRVAWIAGRRDLLTQTAERLNHNISSIVYPDLTAASCYGPDQSPELRQLVERGLSLAADATICRGCPMQRSCVYPMRRRPQTFNKASLVFLTDQLLALRPKILADWGFGRRSLIVLDEAKGADQGFVRTFTLAQVEADLRALGHVPQKSRLPGVVDLLQRIIGAPSAPGVTKCTEQEVASCSIAMQIAGAEDNEFRHVTPLAYQYARMPLWYESGTFAVREFPLFPGTVVVLGGFLDPQFVSTRYGWADA